MIKTAKNMLYSQRCVLGKCALNMTRPMLFTECNFMLLTVLGKQIFKGGLVGDSNARIMHMGCGHRKEAADLDGGCGLFCGSRAFKCGGKT